MATNKILNIPQWLLVGSSSQPDLGYSSIFPKLGGPTGSWYVVDDQNNEKRLAFDYEIGAGISQSVVGNPSPYGYRLDIQLGGGLSYSQGFYSGAPISVFGITPSMLSITGSNGPGYVLSTSTVSGEFQWVPNSASVQGTTNKIPKFSGSSLTASQITDTGTLVYIGNTPSNTSASFSVDGSVNVGKSGSDAYLYFGDQVNNFINGENGGGLIIRTTDEFRVELFTNSATTYKAIDFDNLGGENRTLSLMDGVFQFGDLTYSKYLSASNLDLVHFGKTQSAFQLELISGSQGAIKIQDGGQGSYSLLVSDSSGVGTWQKFYGYNGLTTSGLGIGLNLTNIQGLTLSGGTFGIDYTKFAAPISVSNTFTVSIATVSVVTGVTYGSVFETPVIRVDQFGRITTIGTVSTSAFTGPQGSTGPQGFTGAQGFTGPQGFTGAQGFTGPQGSTGASFADLITATFGAVLVYGEFGWTALGPATAGYVLTTGGTGSLPYWSEPIAGSGGSGFFTFSRNFDVVLNGQKSFGKYLDGQTIYSTGWTLEEFIYDVVTEIKAPTIYLTAEPAVIPFGATGDSITLNFGYTIINAGATAVSGELGYSTDGKLTYTPLFTGTATSNTLVHTISFPEYTSPTYDYKYTVVDSVGGSASAEDSVSVAPYVSPTVTTTVIANTKNTSYGETDLKRQYGNVSSQITLTYSRNSPRIDVLTYSLYYRVGSGAYNQIYGPLSVGDPSSGSETDDHTTLSPTTNPSLAQTTNNIDYYHQVDDEYSTIDSTRARVTFEQLYFYGPTVSNPANRTDLLTLTNVKLSSAAGDVFTFTTGTTHNKFIVAVPITKTIASVVDIGGSSPASVFFDAPIVISVDNFDGSDSHQYNLYVNNTAIAYNPSTTFRVTLNS